VCSDFFFEVSPEGAKEPPPEYFLSKRRAENTRGKIKGGGEPAQRKRGQAQRIPQTPVQRGSTKSRREKKGKPDIDVLPHDLRKPSTPKDGVVAASFPDM
jgi:hypothetical protein